MTAPQIVVVVLLAIEAGVFLALNGQARRDEYYSFWMKLGDIAVLVALLTWGGFWK